MKVKYLAHKMRLCDDMEKSLEEGDYDEFLVLCAACDELDQTILEESRGDGSRVLRRPNLLMSAASPWRKIRNTRNNDAFLHFFAFDVRTFDLLCRMMAVQLPWRVRRAYSFGKPGRPYSLDHVDLTALVLHYLTTRVGRKTLQLIFGVTASALRRDLRCGLQAMQLGLTTIHDAQVKWPSHLEIETWASAICSDPAPPLPVRPFAFMDGMSMPIDAPVRSEEQTVYYSDYYRETCINNMFVFSPEGTIIWHNVNMPGSWDDISVAALFFAKVLGDEHLVPDGFRVMVNSGFRCKTWADKLLFPLKEGDALHSDPVIRKLQLKLHRWIVSKRRAAEWAMDALKCSFPRLCNPLSNKRTVRQRLLLTIIGLFNFRTRQVGGNQIKTVYMDALQNRLHAIENSSGVIGYVDDEL